MLPDLTGLGSAHSLCTRRDKPLYLGTDGRAGVGNKLYCGDFLNLKRHILCLSEIVIWVMNQTKEVRFFSEVIL